MKKWIAMLLAVLTAVSLTACAAKNGGQETASDILSGQAIPKMKNSRLRAAIIPKKT